MNKKNIIIVLAIILVLTLGIGGFVIFKIIDNKPFRLEDKYYENMSIVDINAEKYNKLVDNKESFILYMYLDGCTTCAAFKPIATEFVLKNKITVYRIEYKELAKTDLKIDYAPSFALIKKGKLKAYLDAESQKDIVYYKDANKLQSWVEKYVDLEHKD